MSTQTLLTPEDSRRVADAIVKFINDRLDYSVLKLSREIPKAIREGFDKVIDKSVEVTK